MSNIEDWLGGLGDQFEDPDLQGHLKKKSSVGWPLDDTFMHG